MASISVDRSGICNECAARIDAGNGQMHVDRHIDQYERMNDLLGVLKTITSSVSTASAVRGVEQRWSESPSGLPQ